jgi:hypothetical protein
MFRATGTAFVHYYMNTVIDILVNSSLDICKTCLSYLFQKLLLVFSGYGPLQRRGEHRVRITHCPIRQPVQDDGPL